MTAELDLWHRYRAALIAHATEKTAATREARRAAHAAWVRVHCPADADAEIAAERNRLEAERYAA